MANFTNNASPHGTVVRRRCQSVEGGGGARTDENRYCSKLWINVEANISNVLHSYLNIDEI